MHELSIAQSLIEAACEAAVREGDYPVVKLHVRIGALAGVVAEALLFSFELAADGTLCAGAMLEIESVPVSVFCNRCNEPRTLAESFHFICPTCGAATPTILTGRELELVSLELADHAATNR